MFGLFKKEKPVVVKEKTPEELLYSKYRELIHSNGISYSMKDNGETYMPSVAISINGTDIVGVLHLEKYNPYSRSRVRPEEILYGHILGDYCTLGLLGGSDIANLVRGYIMNVTRKEKVEEERLEKNDRMIREAKLKEAEDKKYMDEYLRLCGHKNTHEFDQQFQILSEIEQLGKDQETLLATWKKNVDLIAEKRAKFYSIK